MIWVRLQYLPADSAIASLGDDMSHLWTIEAHLLDDLRMWLTSTKKHPAKPHPARPTAKGRRLNPARIAAGRSRRAERRRQIAEGQIT